MCGIEVSNTGAGTYGFAAGCLDLGNDFVGGAAVLARTIFGTTQIIDYHLGTMGCRHHGDAATDATTGAGDYDYLVLQ
jgi:hypothetical protein